MKPTYGRVSRYGIAAYSSSLDQCGPITQNVEDAALLYDIISGYDPKDSTSANKESIAVAPLLNPDKKLTIAVSVRKCVRRHDEQRVSCIEYPLRKCCIT